MPKCWRGCGATIDVIDDEHRYCRTCGARQYHLCPYEGCGQGVSVYEPECPNPKCKHPFITCRSCHRLLPVAATTCSYCRERGPLADTLGGFYTEAGDFGRTYAATADSSRPAPDEKPGRTDPRGRMATPVLRHGRLFCVYAPGGQEARLVWHAEADREEHGRRPLGDAEAEEWRLSAYPAHLARVRRGTVRLYDILSLEPTVSLSTGLEAAETMLLGNVLIAVGRQAGADVAKCFPADRDGDRPFLEQELGSAGDGATTRLALMEGWVYFADSASRVWACNGKGEAKQVTDLGGSDGGKVRQVAARDGWVYALVAGADGRLSVYVVPAMPAGSSREAVLRGLRLLPTRMAIGQTSLVVADHEGLFQAYDTRRFGQRWTHRIGQGYELASFLHLQTGPEEERLAYIAGETRAPMYEVRWVIAELGGQGPFCRVTSLHQDDVSRPPHLAYANGRLFVCDLAKGAINWFSTAYLDRLARRNT